jgi:cell division protein FtsB
MGKIKNQLALVTVLAKNKEVEKLHDCVISLKEIIEKYQKHKIFMMLEDMIGAASRLFLVLLNMRTP